jgi:putative membrane protein
MRTANATSKRRIASHTMMYNERDSALGDHMTRTTQIVCCAVLSFASSLMPSKATAQSDDDKKFLAMAAQSDQNEIALSKLAEQKATNPAVKTFAAR